MKKVLSVILTLVMLIGIVPIANLNLQASALQDRSYNFNKNYDYNADPGQYMANIAFAQLRKSQSSMGYTEPWCADFVSDCARLAGQTAAIPAHGGVNGLHKNVCDAGGYVVSSRKAGDLIFYYCSSCGRYVHVGIVIDGSYTVEGNYNSQVSKVSGSYYDENGHTTNGSISKEYVRPNYHGSVTPPTNVWVSLPNGPESSYLPNTEVNITFGADNATSYYIEMYRQYNGETNYYYSITLSTGILHASFDKLGHYSCYVVASNSSGSVTSNWIGWDIVNAPPSNVWVALPNGPESSYLPNTEVKITFGADYADTFHMTMCREYKGVVDWNYYKQSFRKRPDGNDVCHASFDKPGHYSCYITATNMAGGTSSKWIGWDIVESKPTNLTISTDEQYYPINETVKFTLNAEMGYYKHIGIHKIVNSQDHLYYEQDVNGTSCSVQITEPGNYRANFDAFNVCGMTRSGWVYFTVIENKPGKPTVTIKPGTSVSPTKISWENTTDTKYYDIYIKSSNGDLIKYITDYTDLEYSIVLPEGNYKVNVCSCGYIYDWWTSAGYQSFSVKSGSYTVNFNASGGSCSTVSKTVTYDSAYGALPTASRTGFAFGGWFTAANGGTRVVSTTKVTAAENHTLYAHWSHDTFIIRATNLNVSGKHISGSQLLSMSAADLKGIFENTNVSVRMANEKRMATGTTVNLTDDTNTVYDTMTVVIFGDVNGDGLFDGADSMLVNCLANGLLTESQVGSAVYAAADCSHDGKVDAADVTLLAQAGLHLSDVTQTV